MAAHPAYTGWLARLAARRRSGAGYALLRRSFAVNQADTAGRDAWVDFYLQADAGPTVVSATLVAAGTSVPSFAPQAIASVSTTMAGAGAASWAGALVLPATLAAAGSGAAAFTAAQVLVRALAAPGSAAITWQGSDGNIPTIISSAVLSSAGQGMATWQGQYLLAGAFAMPGAAGVAFAGAAVIPSLPVPGIGLGGLLVMGPRWPAGTALVAAPDFDEAAHVSPPDLAQASPPDRGRVLTFKTRGSFSELFGH